MNQDIVECCEKAQNIVPFRNFTFSVISWHWIDLTFKNNIFYGILRVSRGKVSLCVAKKPLQFGKDLLILKDRWGKVGNLCA